MARFKDYDAAGLDLEPEIFEFRLGGRDFTATSEVDARQVLTFMRLTVSRNSADVARAFQSLLGDEVWDYINQRIQVGKDGVESRQKITWLSVRALANDLAVFYGGGVVGDPKVERMDPQLDESPQMEGEPSKDGLTPTSGSSIIGDLLSEEELLNTDTVLESSSISPGEDS